MQRGNVTKARMRCPYTDVREVFFHTSIVRCQALDASPDEVLELFFRLVSVFMTQRVNLLQMSQKAALSLFAFQAGVLVPFVGKDIRECLVGHSFHALS